MEIGLVGSPISGWDFPQSISFEKFSDDEFSCGSLVVESPEVQRFQGKIGYDHMVSISRHLEERELPGRFFGDETSHHDEALSGFPFPGFVFEFGEPKSRRDLFVSKTTQLSLNRFGNLGNDRIGARDLHNILGQGMVVEGRVAPHTDVPDTGRKFGKALLQNIDAVGNGMHIAREINAFPDIACFSFEAEKGLIGRTPSLFGVEPYSGSLLLSIDRQHFGVEVEDHRGNRIGLYQKMATETVVEIPKGCQAFGTEAFQKSP